MTAGDRRHNSSNKYNSLLKGLNKLSTATYSNVQVSKWSTWDGSLSNVQQELFAKMKPVVDDMNRESDPAFFTWYEHTQWQWKQWEYSSVLNQIDLSAAAGCKVLDAGCGYTPLIRYLASIGMEAYGFDWDAKEIESNLSKSSSLLHGNLVKYHKQDMRDMKWPSDFFDYTVCVSVLEHLFAGQNIFQKAVDKFLPPENKVFHINNVRRAIHEMIRVTKPGGQIILTMDCGFGGGIPVQAVEKLLDIQIKPFPDIETIRQFWKNDEYYMHRNRMLPGVPREYTSLLAVLQKLSPPQPE